MTNVNFEFLDRTPIENVITCLNYKLDKVVYFGYQDIIDDQRVRIERFLFSYCGVKEVQFFQVCSDNLLAVEKVMSEAIEKEINIGNNIFFDLTGGEDLVLVAFGKLSERYVTPMHKFDVINNKLIELNYKDSNSINTKTEQQNINMNLDMYIELQGGVINYGMQKSLKTNLSKSYREDVTKIWSVAKNNWEYWNLFSGFIRNNMIPNDKLQVDVSERVIKNKLGLSNTKLNSIGQINKIINELKNINILTCVNIGQGRYKYKYKNKMIKECLWEGGSILELHTSIQEEQNCNDLIVGAHLEWDGKIHEQVGIDVLNEIDVLTLKGNITTFISCKTGKMGPQQTLHALYELQTVVDRFGDKYSKKILVTARALGKVYMERAVEMGIEVR